MAKFRTTLQDTALKHFFEHPTQAFYVKELASRLEVDLGNLSRLLKYLHKEDILISKKQGKYLTYKLNQDHPLLDKVNIQKKPVSLPLNLRTLIHGQEVSAKELEIVSSGWGALKFARFCNALVSEELSQKSKEDFISLSLNERINVKDSGIDADCNLEWKQPQDSYLRTGVNIFQYKMRDATSTRERTLSTLKGSLKEEVKGIKGPIANYILFLNLDLSRAEKDKLISAIKDGLREGVTVQVRGAGDLAADCNRFPRIRSTYFVPADFTAWHEAFTKEKASPFWPWVEFIGRAEDVAQLKKCIADPKIKVIYVIGPQGIGKTRVVLEATASVRDQVVFILDRRKFNPKDILLLESLSETVIIADDPETEELNEATREIFSKQNLKLVVMLPTPTEVTKPGFGFDARSEVISIKPMSNEDSDKLLRLINKNIGYDHMAWIKYHANGNPGILLAAGMATDALREQPENFIDSLGSHYEKRISKIFGSEALLVLQLLSVSTFVGFSDAYKKEIETILKILGPGISLNQLILQIEKLEKAGLINRKGSFVEVSIPLLATYLAQQIFKGREADLIQLFAELEGSARLRFLKRVARLNTRTISEFWDRMFSREGLFGNLESMRVHSNALAVISAAVPDRMLEFFSGKLESLPLDQRKDIKDDFRSDFRWALESLIMRQLTSLKALELMGLLGEAENETWANNATGVFCEAFYPIHPQIPIKLQDRFELLKKFASKSESSGKRLLAIKAMKGVFSRHFSHSVRESRGFLPYEGRPFMTYGDIWEYFESITSLLFELVSDDDPQIAKAAAEVLPMAVSESMIQGRSDKELEKMKELHRWALKGQKIEITDFTEALNRSIRRFKEMIPKAKDKKILQGVLDELLKMKEDFVDLSFESKVRRWAGKWTHDCDDERENGVFRYQVELDQLAFAAIKEPSLLSTGLMEWLRGEAEKGGTFFFYLGKNDSERKLLSKFDGFAKNKEWARAYGAYTSGLFSHSEQFLYEHAEKLYSDKSVHAESLFSLISLFKGNKQTVDKICDLLFKGSISGDLVANTIVLGRWIEPLEDKDLARLVRSIAGKDYECDYSVLNLLSMWKHLNKTISGEIAEIAWQCLETARPLGNRQKTWDYDEVAQVIVKQDIPRGFRLARKLIQAHRNDCWNPIDRYSGGKFWQLLSEANPKEALELLLELSLTDASMQFHITWNLTEIVDQQRDADIILELCKNNKNYAEILTRSLTTARPGFWPIALKLIEWYGDDERILSNIMGGIERLGHMHTGGYHLRLLESVQEVESALKIEKLNSKVRIWLTNALELFKVGAEKTKLREDNDDVERFA